MKETKFKQTEVGMIPCDWEVKKLGDIAQYRRGSFPQPYGLPKWYDGKGAMPFVQVADVSTDSFCLNSETKQQISTLAQPMSVFVPKNSVLVTLQGSIGKVAITQYDSYVDRTLAIFKAYNLPMSSIYFSYQLSKKFAIEREKAPGGIIKTITKEAFSDFCLPLPPTIKEQQRIANALSDVDTLIANLEKLIAKKKNIKQGAMQQLLTGRKRLPGFAPAKPTYKQTELGMIPSDWEVKTISQVGKIIGGGTPSTFNSAYWNGSVQWFTPAELSKAGKYVSKSERTITKLGVENCSAKILPAGTILLTTRASIGTSAILKAPACTNQGFQSLVVNSENSNEFLYYLLSTKVDEMMSLASGSTFLEISPKKLGGIQLQIPSSRAEQTAIANVLSDMDTEISALETKLAKYRTLKTGMMQQLLTGKIRLIKAETIQK